MEETNQSQRPEDRRIAQALEEAGGQGRGMSSPPDEFKRTKPQKEMTVNIIKSEMEKGGWTVKGMTKAPTYTPDRAKFNSYIEWRQNNPNGTYADYRQAREG